MESVSIGKTIQLLYGRSGAVSVAGDLLGLFRKRVPTPVEQESPLIASVRTFLNGIRGGHINLNMIEFGVDEFTDDDDATMDHAIVRVREIYGNVGIGVGRIRWFGVEKADAEGYDRPTTHSDGVDMTNLVIIKGDAIDVAIPAFNAMSPDDGGAAGIAPTGGGPCEDKDQKYMNGIFVGMEGLDGTAIDLAHELGHYLGLGHEWLDSANVMFPGSYSGLVTKVHFNSAQVVAMLNHCMVRPGLSLPIV